MRKSGKLLVLLLILTVVVPSALATDFIKILAQGIIWVIEIFEEKVLVPITNFMQAEVDKQQPPLH